MRQQARLAIVIPTWNDAEGLRATLQGLSNLPAAVQDQLEVVVVDGASSDATLDVAAAHSTTIDHLVSQPDEGVYDAMNRGVTRCRAPWVLFLGAGDVVLEEGIMHALEQLRRTDRAHALAYSVKALEPREPGVPALFSPRWDASIQWRNTIHHQGLIVPFRWLQERPFDVAFRVLADYAWLLDGHRRGDIVHCHAQHVLAAVPGGGLSRQFNGSLYMEEWTLKSTRLAWLQLACHLAWLPAKWAFKQRLSTRSI